MLWIIDVDEDALLGNQSALAIMKEVMSLLSEYNASHVADGVGRSSDTKDWIDAGVPAAELESANEKYFYFHHSKGKLIYLHRHVWECAVAVAAPA